MQELNSLFLLGCTTPFDFISLCVGVVSIILAVVSIWYAIKCNKDSNRVNKQTSNMLLDMQYMMAFNMRAICELQHRLRRTNNSEGRIRLKKDGIKFHKLSTFSTENFDRVMELLSNLSIKRRFLNDLQEFIKSEEKDYPLNFFSAAETIDESRLDVIVAELAECGLLVGIYYN